MLEVEVGAYVADLGEGSDVDDDRLRESVWTRVVRSRGDRVEPIWAAPGLIQRRRKSNWVEGPPMAPRLAKNGAVDVETRKTKKD